MRVLLAEDDMKLGKLTQYMLEQNGVSTEWVTAGDAIYDYAMYEEYDVLILDWMLPEMSGVDACRKLRKDGYQRAILLLTARDALEDRVTGLDAGADDYLGRRCHKIIGTGIFESGTGCVHTAPGYGVEDFEVCKKYVKKFLTIFVSYAKISIRVGVLRPDAEFSCVFFTKNT